MTSTLIRVRATRPSGWKPSGRPGRWLYDMPCLQPLTGGTRMEVVLDASVLLDPTVLEVVQRAQIKASNARRHKLAAAQAYTNKAAARAIQLRVPRARGSIR